MMYMYMMKKIRISWTILNAHYYDNKNHETFQRLQRDSKRNGREEGGTLILVMGIYYEYECGNYFRSII